MRITRVYTGDDNLSHFEDIELEFDPNIGRFPRAMVQPAREVGFNTQPADSRDVMHNAPERRFVIFMSGQVKVELSDGESRVAGAGDVILFEDVTGEGHLLTPLGDEPRYSMFVGLGG